MKFSFAVRLSLIIIFGLAALTLSLAVLNYVQRGQAIKDVPRLPLPEQVTAMVDLFESAPLDKRAILLKAFNTSNTQVSVTETEPNSLDRPRLIAVERPLTRFLQQLGGREVRAYADQTKGIGLQANEPFFLPSEFTVVIKLVSQDYLVLNIRDTINTRVFGVPPGFWAGIGGFVIAMVMMIAVLREIGPLQKLAKAVTRFSKTAEPEMVAEKGARDVQQVIRAFNQMQQKIDRLLRGRVFMLSAISHDIRTYLTRFRLRSEKINDPELKNAMVSNIEDMSNLIDEALELARATTGKMLKEKLDLLDILRSECEKASLSDGDVVLFNKVAEPLIIYADELSVRRVFSNILDNALKYGKRAEVHLMKQGEKAVVWVEDYGTGIPAAYRNTVFEPFQRIETSRNRETGGAGLGLAIAYELASQNEARLSISEGPHGGARLVVEFI